MGLFLLLASFKYARVTDCSTRGFSIKYTHFNCPTCVFKVLKVLDAIKTTELNGETNLRFALVIFTITTTTLLKKKEV